MSTRTLWSGAARHRALCRGGAFGADDVRTRAIPSLTLPMGSAAQNVEDVLLLCAAVDEEAGDGMEAIGSENYPL